MLLKKEEIKLNKTQEKMIKSGWGENICDETKTELVTYLSDGLKVKGYVTYPIKEGQYPCVVWCRGGVGNNGVIDEFNARGMFGKIAANGYVVFAPQYRGNLGGEGYDEFGGRDLDDIFNITKIASEFNGADTKIWGIEGWSRGGLMTYLALTQTDMFKAAIVTGGISNIRHATNTVLLFNRIKEISEKNIGQSDFNDIIAKRSVINFVEKISNKTPLLIIHGTHDERVSAKDPIELSLKLLELNKTFKLVMLEKGDHFLKKHRAEVDRLRFDWFSNFLK